MDKINEEKFKSYFGKGIEIKFFPDRCIHSGICTSNLSIVFNTRKKPWVNPDLASIEEIKSVIDRCPSGALQYEIIK